MKILIRSVCCLLFYSFLFCMRIFQMTKSPHNEKRTFLTVESQQQQQQQQFNSIQFNSNGGRSVQ
jgi:hypothetical protein